LKIAIFGLSITSAWGNGHATTYRALVRALARRNHRVIFFEKNQEWYESNRDLPEPEFCELRLFNNWRSALPKMRRELQSCDVAVLGSYFPDGTTAADMLLESNVPVKAFYDIDTPITVAKLRSEHSEYLQARQVPGFDVYFSFTGGPILRQLESEFGARRAVPLYCSFDEEKYRPRNISARYQCDLSYMGTYAADRQPKVNSLFLDPAKAAPQSKFLLAGPQYPRGNWPKNVRHIKHLSPRWHPHFYSSSRLTLNLTREAMVASGFSPSVRLFEAAACACPIISDYWKGLDTVFQVGREILVAENSNQVTSFLNDIDDAELRCMAALARERVLAEHSSAHRAEQFENHVASARDSDSETNLTLATSLAAQRHVPLIN